MENLITNPGFELPIPDDWKAYKHDNPPTDVVTAVHTWDSTSCHSGSRSAKVEIVEVVGSGTAGWLQRVPKDFFKPGKFYTLYAWYKSSVLARLRIFFFDAAWRQISWRDRPLLPAADWQNMPSLEFTTPDGVDWDSVAFIQVVTIISSVGTLSVDDYSMYETVPIVGTVPIIGAAIPLLVVGAVIGANELQKARVFG